MNDRQARTWQETLWRRPLSPAEAQQLKELAGHSPELAEALETETALTELLAQLPDAPLSSNFTARVLQAIDTQAAQAAAALQGLAGLRDWLARFGPRLAWATALVLVGWLGWNQYQVSRRAQAMAAIVPMFQAAALPDPRLLQDFDAIVHLSELPSATDLELLNALAQ